MKILAVLPLYPPRSRVGAWLTTHDYLVALAARGHQVDVIVQMSNEVTQPTYDLDGVHVHPRTWDQYTRPDVVISHLGDYHEGARYAERTGIPSVRMVHGYDHQAAIKLDQTPTALAVFSSLALARDTAWDGNGLIAHPPIDPDRYRVEPGDQVTLVNLSEAKGGGVLRRVATDLPTVSFLGVRSWGEQLLDQPANVEIIDPVEDVRDVYRRTRVLLMPSEYESYGRVGVEAACSGIPTVAHPSPGLLEAMGDAATWVDRDNHDKWTETVSALRDRMVWTIASDRARHAIQRKPETTIATVADAIEHVAKVAA